MYIKKFIKNLLKNPEQVSIKLTKFEVEHAINDESEKYIVEDKPIASDDIIIFPIEEDPEVSIIIPVYNQWEYTYRCLKSIKENTADISFEIILVDDVSIDETVNILKYVKNINVIRNVENQGFLRNCNLAASKARGKYIHLLNNDTKVLPNWLSSLTNTMNEDDSVGLCGSKLVYPDGRLQEAGGIIWKDASGWNFGKFDDPSKPEYNYVKEVDYISGASILIRKSLWDEVGGFDERYIPAYFEDSDFAFEVRKHGYKVVYNPRSEIIHFEGISNGTNEEVGIKNYQVKNKDKFIDKWKSELAVHYENGCSVLKARERGYSKKYMLVIDHYVPHFDQDAGSRTMYQVLELFVSMGIKISFIGDNFYKHEPYTTMLENLGIEVLYGIEMHKNYEKWIRENGKYFDFVFLNRPHISIKYIDMVRKYTNAKILYNGADIHWLRLEREYELKKDSNILKERDRIKKIEEHLYKNVDIILSVSTYERDILKELFPEKIVKTMPIYIFDNSILPEEFIPYEARRDLLFVGGFKHSPNEDGVLWFSENIFPEVLKEIPDIKLNVVGSHPTDRILSLKSESINVLGFVSDEELDNLYSKSKVIVAPLRYGAGAKGKVVEAIAHGVPMSTTTAGAEGIIRSDEILKISDIPHDMVEDIVSLYTNKEQWQNISQEMRKYTEEFLTENAARRFFYEILDLK